MTERERERFRLLLLVAKESPYTGERRNALAAATRMAARAGLTLEEAARSGGEAYQAPSAAPRPPKPSPDASGIFRSGVHRSRARTARFFMDAEARQAREKRRHEEALAAAYARGLDREDGRPERNRKPPAWRPNTRRRSPASHARVLIEETRLSLAEIASISGLDLWSVAGLKLRMRGGSANLP